MSTTTYPSKEILKVELQKVCSSEKLIERLSSNFGGQTISCNHRIAQVAAFRALEYDQDAKPSDAEACSKVLCSYVDEHGCKTN